MAPPPTIFTLRNSRVHGSSLDCGDIITYIEALVDKEFSVTSALYIPNVNPDNGHVYFGRDFDDPWSGCKGDVIEDVVLF